MFYVNNKPILASELEVLQELKSQLALQGIDRFEKFIETENHIQFNCPIHKGGHERTPSCGITKNKIVTELGNGHTKVVQPGTVHCFKCGYVATLEEMISDCFGKNDMGIFGNQWLLKNFLSVAVETRKDIELDFSRNNKVSKNANISYISEDELDKYRYTHPYMYQRKLTDEVINLFDVGYDPNFIINFKDKNGKPQQKVIGECLTFPIHDKDGNVIFIARRAIHSKIFHYPEGVLKPVYGIFQLPKNCNEIILCESIINALTCYVYGKVALAFNGTGTPQQYEELLSLPCRHFILALDPDEAGYKGEQRLKKYFKNRKMLSKYIIPEGKDINDLSRDEFNNLQEVFL